MVHVLNHQPVWVVPYNPQPECRTMLIEDRSRNARGSHCVARQGFMQHGAEGGQQHQLWPQDGWEGPGPGLRLGQSYGWIWMAQ